MNKRDKLEEANTRPIGNTRLHQVKRGGVAVADPVPILSSQENDLSVKILVPAIAYVRDKYGQEELMRLAGLMGVDIETLKDRNQWISIEQINTFLESVRALVGSDDEFRTANTYRLKESYGPLRFLLCTMSPRLVYELAQKHFPAISRITTSEVVTLSWTHIVYRYWSTKKEGRLMCLSRQAQGAALPTLWGLPPAHLPKAQYRR